VTLLGCGLVAGAINIHENRLGYFGYAVSSVSNMDPHLFLLVFLPALIFESAFSVNFHIIKREATQALVLAGPGVVISMILIAILARYVFSYG
jgi:NhaP-type Na+/H+ or K+/H+ antiporter